MEISEEFNKVDKLFSEQIEVTIYRICQELINNAVKHSKTNSLSALFKKNEQNIQINFEDNGIGFDENNSKNGIGLNSIKNRVEMVGGTIEKDYTHENSSTIFYIKLPL
jgi:signal transduction histidine kinase